MAAVHIFTLLIIKTDSEAFWSEDSEHSATVSKNGEAVDEDGDGDVGNEATTRRVFDSPNYQKSKKIGHCFYFFYHGVFFKIPIFKLKKLL
jgi:hypothetical protein